jgi:hypothetical protein
MSDPHVMVTAVEPLTGHWVRLTFADGAVHEVDLAPLLASGGVFTPIRDDRAVFEAVSVDPESHTICWGAVRRICAAPRMQVSWRAFAGRATGSRGAGSGAHQ